MAERKRRATTTRKAVSAKSKGVDSAIAIGILVALMLVVIAHALIEARIGIDPSLKKLRDGSELLRKKPPPLN